MLEAGLFGSFTALNFFHWFLFWELSLIPAFFLIKLWGGPRRGPAATQFFRLYHGRLRGVCWSRFLAVFLFHRHWTSLALPAFYRRRCEQMVTAHLGAVIALWLAIGVLAGLRGEGADDSLPHLAARGLR